MSRSRRLEDYGDVLSLADVAAIIDCHIETARLWARHGRLPARRAGKSYFVLKEDLVAWLRAQPLTDADATAAEESPKPL